jgi:hypothetical protein
MEEGKEMVKRHFSRESKYLPLIFIVQLMFLVGLVMLAFVLPLSGSEKVIVVVAAGVLAGLNWAVLDYVRQG